MVSRFPWFWKRTRWDFGVSAINNEFVLLFDRYVALGACCTFAHQSDLNLEFFFVDELIKCFRQNKLVGVRS